METSVSLLQRLRHGRDDATWRRLDDLYRPLILKWLHRDPRLRDDADDIAQDVMHVLIRELPGFQRQRNGSFRRWLRMITVHRVLTTLRSRNYRPQALGSPLEESPFSRLDDPNSDLSQIWDQEHDQYVLRRLLELIEPMFEPSTLTAFRRVVFEGEKPALVASDVGLSVNAVLLAKSRVLKALRQEAEGLID